jgi:hypothetical protein
MNDREERPLLNFFLECLSGLIEMAFDLIVSVFA